MLSNFTAHDIASLLLAILLFPVVAVVPGYVIGWTLDIFSFKRRSLIAQYVFAIALSNALIPVILYLAYRFVSNRFGIGIIILFSISWAVIQTKLLTDHQLDLDVAHNKIAFAIFGIWISFCVLLLVDIQIGQRLYFNTASYDFTTRTALIEAITRTGIPPINPTYYPGHFERITELYYFWYIMASVIDSLGGNWIDARIALFAGITWTGLALMATISTYLRLRNNQSPNENRRLSTIGIRLLAVSGLDFIPVIAFMIAIKTSVGRLPFDGRIEGWNLPVMSWLNAMTWVPNHVASMAACMIALLAILSNNQETKTTRWIIHVIVAGASIASAFGESVWVAATFGLFMGIWGIFILFRKSERPRFVAIVLSGIFGLLFVSQFLLEILKGGGKSAVTGSLPIGLFVRPFLFTRLLPHGPREILETLLLPVNYFFELGFFLVIAFMWLKRKQNSGELRNNAYMLAETVLFLTVMILLSFVKSTVIVIDDLGMRAWLLGQFVLIIWAVDLLSSYSREVSLSTILAPNSTTIPKQSRDLLRALLIVGIMTTALEAFSTRFWPILVDTGITGLPNELTPDTNLGKRTYDARLAYEFIRDDTPKELIVQNNPLTMLDRPSGLYGSRQVVIGDRTAYGVPAEEFKRMSEEIGQIFKMDSTDWSSLDQLCDNYSIDAIIVNDTDPLWSSLDSLERERPPIYENKHYAVLACGN
jgi:hypothetical protein